MNYDNLKLKMEAFFLNVNPNDLIQDFVDLGYEFESIPNAIQFGLSNVNKIDFYCTTSRPQISGMDDLQEYSANDLLAMAA